MQTSTIIQEPSARGLVVSIHDVRPAVVPAADRMLADLAEIGVGRTSLLVVPDHHHSGKAFLDAAFCGWLRLRVEQGHEAVLHGYHHLRRAQSGDGPVTRFVNGIYTAGEGEFYDLSTAEAAERLARGKQEMETAGFAPRGFIAPAWLLGDAAYAAVRRAGFEYTVTIHGVRDLRREVFAPSRSLVYSVRSGWRRVVSLRWNGWLSARLTRKALIRMSLHPPDWDHPAVREHALGLIAAALAGRPAIPYEEWVNMERNADNRTSAQ